MNGKKDQESPTVQLLVFSFLFFLSWTGSTKKKKLPLDSDLEKYTNFKSSALEIFGLTKKRLDANDASTGTDSGKCMTIERIDKARRVLRQE